MSSSASSNMLRKQIRSQSTKMLVVLVGIMGVTAFAWDFVYTGLMAKLALNGGIWLVWIFGVVMAFITVFRLRNEELAFKALTEAYEDIKQAKTEGVRDPYWRHYRCLSPGTVFERPRLLGHVFEIVYEEMLRTRNLRMDIGTMQTLVHGIEEKLAEERSLVTYLSGLLVFLGLIGAFIGLIQMVQSVGGIVGSLGSATSGGDPSAAFAKLINELQGPLKGMAIGFSSSLFGLAGSLALGLIGRFAAQAGTALKTEFEGWIAHVVKIEDDEDVDVAPAALAAAGGDTRAAQELTQTMHSLGKAFGQSNKSLEKVAELVERMNALQMQQTEAMKATAERLDGLLARQTEMAQASRGLEVRFGEGLGRLATSIDGMGRTNAAGLEKLATQQADAARIAAEAARRPLTVDFAPVEIALRSGLDDLAQRIDRNRAEDRAAYEALVASAARGQGPVHAIAHGSDAVALDEIRRVATTLETALTTGLGEMSETVENAFTAYAELLRATQGRMATAAREDVEPEVAHARSAPDENAEPGDREEKLRKLYERVAQQYQATGTKG